MKSSVLQRSPSRRLVPPAPVTADRVPAPSSIPLPAAFATPQGNVSQPSASAPSFQGLSQELLGQTGNQTSSVRNQPRGRALPASLQPQLETLSGFDLADVRIHARHAAT